MYFQAQAVSCSVAVDGQAGLANGLSGGGIDLLYSGTGFYHFYRGSLGLLDGLIGFFIGSSWAANSKTSGYVAAIAVKPYSEVYKDGVFLFEFSGGGLMMWAGGVWTKGNNCLEAVTRTGPADLKVEGTGQFIFGYARFYVPDGFSEGASGYCGRFFYCGDFAGIFAGAF